MAVDRWTTAQMSLENYRLPLIGIQFEQLYDWLFIMFVFLLL